MRLIRIAFFIKFTSFVTDTDWRGGNSEALPEKLLLLTKRTLWWPSQSRWSRIKLRAHPTGARRNNKAREKAGVIYIYRARFCPRFCRILIPSRSPIQLWRERLASNSRGIPSTRNANFIADCLIKNFHSKLLTAHGEKLYGYLTSAVRALELVTLLPRLVRYVLRRPGLGNTRIEVNLTLPTFRSFE